MTFKKKMISSIVSLLAFTGFAQADDTDLFLNPAGATGNQPNVMISIINGANWNANVSEWSYKRNELVHGAFYDLFASGDFNGQIKLGISTLVAGSPDGGTIPVAVKALDSDHQSAILNYICDGGTPCGTATYSATAPTAATDVPSGKIAVTANCTVTSGVAVADDLTNGNDISICNAATSFFDDGADDDTDDGDSTNGIEVDALNDGSTIEVVAYDVTASSSETIGCFCDHTGSNNWTPTDVTSGSCDDLRDFYNTRDSSGYDTEGMCEGERPSGSRSDYNLSEAVVTTAAATVHDAVDTTPAVAGGTMNIPTVNKNVPTLQMAEVMNYYMGEAIVSGNADTGVLDSDAVDGSNYDSPISNAFPCAKNYQIIIATGATASSSEDNDFLDRMSTLSIDTDATPFDPLIDANAGNDESRFTDEFAAYLASSETDLNDSVDGNQNLITYVIDVSPDASTPTEVDTENYWKSVANSGGGRYFKARNASEIYNSLVQVLKEVQDVSSVFASTALPVSVNVRGTNLNQVYMGVFRPNADNKPQWFGNMKLFQLDYDSSSNSLFLADVNGDPAENTVAGFINDSASSFWSHSNSGTTHENYWEYLFPDYPDDTPDGSYVEKGGAAQILRDRMVANVANRKVYTFDSSGNTVAFNTTNTAAADFGLPDSNYADTSHGELVNWIIGYDQNSEDDALTSGDIDGIEYTDNGTGGESDIRPNIHGDVLHSKPSVVNFEADTSIAVFYGSNDGTIRAVKGGLASTDGIELWSLVLPEHFTKFKTLFANESDGNKPYFVDGGLSVYTYDGNNDGDFNDVGTDKVYLYAYQRRGGSSIYAIDVTDTFDGSPAPLLLWKIDSTVSEMNKLGQTWSAPTVTNIAGHSNPVLIFGGGYDPSTNDQVDTFYDSEGNPTTTDPDTSNPPSIDIDPGDSSDQPNSAQGNAVYIVDAITGELVWSFDSDGYGLAGGSVDVTHQLMHSVPAGVTVVDKGFDGNADHVYVGDTNAVVWKIILGENSGVPDIDVVKFADFSGEGRKIMFPVDVVFDHPYNDSVMIGTGDRENPLDATTANKYFMVKDTWESNWTTVDIDDLYDATDNLIQDCDDDDTAYSSDVAGEDCDSTTGTSEKADLDAASGWFISLDAGEKVISGSVSLGGTTFFNTNMPADDDVCDATLGIARAYAIDFQTGESTIENDNSEGLTKNDRYTKVAGGGFAPTPVPVIVEIDGVRREAVISGPNVQVPPTIEMERRYKVYWREVIDID